MSMTSIVFFDFDGTITKKDSLVDFTQYTVGKKNYYLGLLVLSPMLFVYKFKLIPNFVAKEKFITHFFKGRNADWFQEIAEKYSLECLDKITRPKAIEKIRWHQQEGHKVVIVTASIECWLGAWCEKNGIELISTRLEIKDNMITGKFSTKNCYGIEKIKRVKEIYDLRQYERVFAYGDSRGDKELLDLADESFYKAF